MITERPLLGEVEIERLTDVWTQDAVNLAAYGTFEVSSGTVEVRRNMVPTPQPTAASQGWAGAGATFGGGWASATINTSTTGYFFTDGAEEDIAVGDVLTMSVTYKVTALGTGTAATHIRAVPHRRTGNVYLTPTLPEMQAKNMLRPIVVGQEETVVFTWVATVAMPAGDLDIALTSSLNQGSFGTVTGGFAWQATKVLIERGTTTGSFFDGSVSPDSDLSAAWTGTSNASPSTLTGVGLANYPTPPTVAKGVRSTQWKRSGAYSLRQIPTYPTRGSAYTEFLNHASPKGVERGKTYTAAIWYRQTAIQPSPHTYSRALALVGTTGNSYNAVAQAENVVGEQLVRLKFTVPPTGNFYLRVYSGAQMGDPDSWWDDLTIVEGDYEDETFNGSSLTTDLNVRYFWTGTPNISTSVRETRRTDFMGKATSCSILRGGTRTGLGIKTDVGRMSFTLHNDEDPLNGGTFKIGQTLRAVTGEATPGYFINHPAEQVYSYGFEDYAAVTTPAAVVYTQNFEAVLPSAPNAGSSGFTRTSAYPYAGSYSGSYVGMGASGGTAFLYSPVSLIVGRSYTIQAQVRVASGTGSMTLAGSAEKAVNTTYSQLTHTFTATSATQNIGFTYSGENTYHIDAVTITRDAYDTPTNDGLDGWSGTVSSTRAHTGTYSLTGPTTARLFTGLSVGRTYTLRYWSWTGFIWAEQTETITATASTQLITLSGFSSKDDVTLTRNAWTETIPPVERPAVFTGKVSNVISSYPLDKGTGKKRTSVTVEVSDAVKTHATTPRYGVLIGAPFYESFEERITRYAGSSLAPIEPPPVGAPKVVYAL